jgi:hypothetical protein
MEDPCEGDIEFAGSIKYLEILQWVSDGRLLKKDAAPSGQLTESGQATDRIRSTRNCRLHILTPVLMLWIWCCDIKTGVSKENNVSIRRMDEFTQ